MVEEQILMHKLYEQWFTLRQKRRKILRMCWNKKKQLKLLL
ncbi:hypothetical protein HID58_059632 [Brassica napus]|uniref:Uncharacterized protein n=1 Tax=Brassica napus TaxID=3708 RepID=A0ABQ7ZU85_BRANA|nr:hypothetical protein HID58_059632 [Brassica napus]